MGHKPLYVDGPCFYCDRGVAFVDPTVIVISVHDTWSSKKPEPQGIALAHSKCFDMDRVARETIGETHGRRERLARAMARGS